MTWLGCILVPIGLAALLLSRKWSYRLFVLSIPFSGTVVANVGSGDNASGVQLWLFFGATWLLRELFCARRGLDVRLNRKLIVPYMALLLFVVVAAASLAVPAYTSGTIQIESPLLLDYTTTPLVLSLKQLTALLYIVFGALIAVAVAAKNRQPVQQLETGRIYLGVTCFVCLLGLLQFLCYLAGIPYPGAIFNNSALYSVGGTSIFLHDLAPARVYSVATEPSILGQFLITALPLTIPSLMGQGYLFSRRKDRSAFILIVLTLFLTGSATALAGIIATAAIFGLLSAAQKKGKRARAVVNWMAAFLLAFLSSLVLYFWFSGFRALVNSVVLSKASSYSGLERWKTISVAAADFAGHPLLGLGWGSVTSHDLIMRILANTGLAGFIPFAVMVVSVIYLGLKRAAALRGTGVFIGTFWTLSFLLLIVTNIISEFAYVFGHFWLPLGMALAAAATVAVQRYTPRDHLSAEAK